MKTSTFAPNIRIRELREKAGMTQQMLADATNIPLSTLHQMETDGGTELRQYLPRHRKRVEAIASVLRVDPEDIWMADDVVSGLPYAGRLPCPEEDYMGKLSGRKKLPLKMETHITDSPATELVNLSGHMLDDRIPPDAIVGIKKGGPIDNGLCVVNQNKVIGIWGTFLTSDGGWELRSYNSEPIPLSGEVIGRVVTLEYERGRSVVIERSDEVLDFNL